MQTTDSLKIVMGQMEVVVGQPSRNLACMERMIAEARRQSADLIVFPEMCLGGYFLADRWTDDDYVGYLESFNEKFLALSDGIGVIFGNVGSTYLNARHQGKDGRSSRYNMAFFAHNGAWVPRMGDAPAGRYIKTLQPNYRMFDDDRYFTSSLEDAEYYPGIDFESNYSSPFVFERHGKTYLIGMQVCEDLWSGDYAFDATAHYTQIGCDLIVNISASPWTENKDLGRTKRIREHVENNGHIAPLLYVNAVGMQNTGKNVLSFDGGSSFYASDGAVVGVCNDDFEPESITVSLGEKTAAIRPDSSEYFGGDKLLSALVHALRRFDMQLFSYKPKWIIGLSGGIDSSITCALLKLALDDPDRIIGYNLATRYNSDVTKANAFDLAKALDIKLVNGSIEPVVKATEDVLELYGYSEEDVSGLAQENIQARLRGHMLSTFAGVEGGVIMNNGNKVEVSLGYATLYGDAIGALCPIGDLTKVRLFQLARTINRHFGTEVIPENLIPTETDEGYSWEMMPSAELKEAQTDPMKWFYHDWLIGKICDYPGWGVEKVMRAYLDNGLADTPVYKWVRFYGLDDPKRFLDDLEWVLRQMNIAVFKRIQMPPILTITRGSFGLDFRENQVRFETTDTFRTLKTQILEKI